MFLPKSGKKKKKWCTTNSLLIFCVKVKGEVVSVHAMKTYGRSRSIGPLILNPLNTELNPIYQ